MRKSIFKAVAVFALLALLTVCAISCNSADNAKNALTQDDAKTIALKNLGIAENRAAYTVVSTELLNGQEYFSVETNIDGVSYRTRIDGEGEIVKQYVNDEVVSETPDPTAPMEPENTEYIGVDRAKEIAFADAATDEANVSKLECELDYSYGKYYYEIEFKLNGEEYEYDIDAIDGSIFKKSVDRKTVNEPTVDSEEFIGTDAAKAAAVAHAGVDATNAKFDSVEWERVKGVTVYEIEFKLDGVEYEYMINAVTGEVIYSETETDDDDDDDDDDDKVFDVTNGGLAEDGNVIELLTAEDVKKIALAHAGVSEENVKFDECELEKEGGVFVYELDFECGEDEYEYQISAATGEILSADKESDD